MKVINGINKNDRGLYHEVMLELMEEYFKDKDNIDSYTCFKFWIHYKDSMCKNYIQYFYKLIKDWDDVSFSPYSKSFYSSSNIDWDYKPENSYRISNHWNFYSQGGYHCKIEDESKKYNWLLCKYVNGVYEIVKDLTSDKEFIKLGRKD